MWGAVFEIVGGLILVGGFEVGGIYGYKNLRWEISCFSIVFLKNFGISMGTLSFFFVLNKFKT